MSSEIDWDDGLRPVRAVRHARHPVRADDTSLVGLLTAVGALQQSLDAIAGRLDAIEAQLRGGTPGTRRSRPTAPRRTTDEATAGSTDEATATPKRTRATKAAPAADAAPAAEARRRPSPTRKR